MTSAMKAQNMTQNVLGEMVGVSGAYISLIASGNRTPTLMVARRILDALGEHDDADNL